MKTFNQIVYGGGGFPEEATVVEVRCGDAEEVAAGQVLVVVRHQHGVGVLHLPDETIARLQALVVQLRVVPGDS